MHTLYIQGFAFKIYQDSLVKADFTFYRKPDFLVWEKPDQSIYMLADKHYIMHVSPKIVSLYYGARPIALIIEESAVLRLSEWMDTKE